MSNAFDSLFEQQKKAFDYWTDLSKKTMETFVGNGHKAEAPADLLKEYYERQKALFEGMARYTDPRDIFTKSPDNFKTWVALQTEFAERWSTMLKDNAAHYGAKMPDWSAAMGAKPFENGAQEWSAWLKKSNDWLRENILAKMPASMQEHYKNYSASYADLYRYWESFSQMMALGVTQQDIVEKYFSPDAYKAFVDKFMGFKSVGSVSDLLDNANRFFDEYAAALSKWAPSMGDASENWRKMLEGFRASDLSPMYKAILDLNAQLHDDVTPYVNVMGEGKETKAIKILRDIQFAYVAYVVKSAEMQTKVYQAGSVALPKVLKAYYEEYRKSQQMPEYQAFYNQYVNELEKCITAVLESKDYSVLQSDVAKTGVTVKAKYGELVELWFSDLPFVMQTQVDDIALENATLRKKLRSLEERVAQLEKPTAAVETPPSVADEKPKAAKVAKKK